MDFQLKVFKHLNHSYQFEEKDKVVLKNIQCVLLGRMFSKTKQASINLRQKLKE